MIRIGKVCYIAVIFMLIAMLAAGDGLCLDSLRPYVQFENPTKKPNRRQRILEENREKLEYLYKVRKAADKSEEELKKAMRPSTWKIIERLKQDPSDDLQDVVKFDEMLYYELRAALNPDAPTGLAKDLLKNHTEIFSKRYDLNAEKIIGLLRKIFQAAALKGMTEKEIVIVKQYVSLPGDSWPEIDRKAGKVKELFKSGKPMLHKNVFDKYQNVSYGFLWFLC